MEDLFLVEAFCPLPQGTQTVVLNHQQVKGYWQTGFYVEHLTRQVCPIGNDYLKPEEKQDLLFYSGFADWGMSRVLEYVSILPETVMRSTGLRDKNHQPIREHHRVRVQFAGENEAYETHIRWQGDSGCPSFDLADHNFDCNGLSYIMNNDDCTIEVIGTIFDIK